VTDHAGEGGLAAKYDTIAYAAQPCPWSHPDHLAAVATLFGLAPPATRTCRTLEVGCSDGANLLPMAVSLPHATFVGCDLAARPIDAAHAAVAAIGLPNIRFVQADLSALGEDIGTFDYIVAHGVYSWVPAAVRDALFALAAQHLAPNGVMFVSYNTFPGCHVRRATWDILHFHVDSIKDPPARLDAARALAALLALPGTTNEDSDAALRAEFARIAQRTDSALFHDDLGTPNDPVYFHEFVAHAGRHGLAYVAEAAVATMSGDGLSAEVRQMADGLDRLTREQYLDFAHFRRYRQSLLVRADPATDFTLMRERVSGMQVSASTALIRAAAEGRIAPGDPRDTTRALQLWLLERAPGAASVADARAWLALRGARDADVPAPSIEDLIVDAVTAGLALLHVAPPPVATGVGDRPVASPLARWQATHRDHVTNLRHEAVRIGDAAARQVLTLLDGSRDRDALVDALAGQSAGDDRRVLAGRIDQYLHAFARLALLSGR
jgi:SAM-dependent methyltransferase